MNNLDFKDNNLKAILGPTNTGKTFYAMERMLSHASGMIGFPLRLLARENYDKAVNIVGLNNVALITGEEKIIPKNAKYFCCTVEAKNHSKSPLVGKEQARDYANSLKCRFIILSQVDFKKSSNCSTCSW